jgi:protein-S-isoprenylcysteine O-methyltransferase Ste14
VKNQQSASFVRAAVMLLIGLVLIPLLPVLISGRLGWWQVWVLAAVVILSFLVSRAVAARRNPGILAERASYGRHENVQPWDRWLSPLTAFGSAFILLAAGLEARFNGPAGFSFAVQVPGMALILFGYGLASYAFVENAFFSGTVRLQTERGHHVISSGPYGWVRHPGYAGSLLASLGMPLWLDSAWSFLPAAAVAALIFLRTRLEDRFLQESLPGYRNYARKVRYRLLPGIW